jgi:type VI secretion system secreted protein Hcp
MAAVDYFLKIDGVDGESQDRAHPNSIELLSFSWGETNASNVAHGGGGGAGRVSMQDLHFTMKVNKASPTLMLACATGKHFQKVTLSCRKAGESQQDFLKFTLSEVLVSSYQSAGDGSADPTEQLSLNFLKIQMAYSKQSADGSVIPVETLYDQSIAR